uniref:Uncharacterized protein n=1 Tax=Strongyloides venezuelensis TaxID=75913 RepID=A0A0K0FSJ0_STRVS
MDENNNILPFLSFGNVPAQIFQRTNTMTTFLLCGMYLYLGRDNNEFNEFLINELHINAVTADQITKIISKGARGHSRIKSIAKKI